MKRLVTLIVSLLAVSSTGFGQGLADVAKKEEARRKTVPQAGKVYTNGNLKPDITRSQEPTPTNATPPAPSTKVPEVNLPGGKVEPAAPEKGQAFWAARIAAARSALDRSRIFADALQSRLNALSTDFVNRDDPAQRSQIEIERQRTVSELDRVKREIGDQTKAIADIEEEARKAGVPPGWLR
jgi:SMC interacting uncharacterized protein involved in chromosome segregation